MWAAAKAVLFFAFYPLNGRNRSILLTIISYVVVKGTKKGVPGQYNQGNAITFYDKREDFYIPV